MAGASTTTPAETQRGPWRAMLGWALLYVGVATFGRLTVLTSAGVALFWPAAGVAALWLLLTPPRHLRHHAVALWVVTVLANLGFGADLVPALLFGVANLVQGLVLRGVLVVVARGAPVTLRTPQDAWRVLLASVLASVTSLPFGNLAAWLDSDSWSALTALAWLVRNSAGSFGAVTLGLVLVVRPRGVVGGRGAPARLSTRGRRTAGLELLALLGTSAAVHGLVLGSARGAPVAFVLVALAVWAGQRFSPLVALPYAVGCAMAVAGATTAGLGPFGSIEEPLLRALVCQAFIVLSVMVALLLALGAQERLGLIAELESSRGAVRRQAELLDAVVERVESGVLVLDEDGEVVIANDLARRFVAATSFATVDGFPLERDAVTGARPRQATGTTPGPEPAGPPYEVVATHPDGPPQVLEVASVRLGAPREGGLRVVTLLDVTRRREREQELEGFAGVVAHDLQNPLTAVLSWAEVLDDQLQEGAPDLQGSRESLVRITRASERMSTLVRDLLAYTRSHHSSLSLTPVRITDLVGAVARDVAEYAGDEPVHIEVVDSPATAEVDVVLLRQLFANLLSNAVKYVAAGTTPRVCVTATQVDGTVRVEVSDNGIGVAEADRHRVFETFYRAAGTGNFAGTGLGLAICATVAQRHGGSLTVHDRPDGPDGSTFVLTLPAACADLGRPVATGADLRPLPGRAPADHGPASGMLAG